MTRVEYNKAVDFYADNVYRFLLKNIKNEDDAKDVMQDTFMKLWEKKSIVNEETVKSYLFTTAYRTMLDRFKKMKPENLENVTYNEPHHSSQYSDVKELLNEGLKLLNEKQRAAITLRDYEGYSYVEIGSILGMSESQVKVTIFRARKVLKKYIGSIEAVI